MNEQIEEMAKVTMEHCEIDNQCGSCHWSTCNECLAECLYNAGYRKRKEGEWESIADDEELIFRCSCCNEEYSCELDMRLFAKYCPNCGAKMKGGETDA